MDIGVDLLKDNMTHGELYITREGGTSERRLKKVITKILGEDAFPNQVE